MKAKLITPVIAAITLIFGATAIASVGHGKEDIGQPGVSSKVTRTVEVEMGDVFFKPKSIDVKPGETVRFVLRNEGSLLHEFGGERDITMQAANGETLATSKDYGDTWFELGLGTNIKLSKTSQFYGDIERSFGAEIQKKWQINAGVRFEF